MNFLKPKKIIPLMLVLIISLVLAAPVFETRAQQNPGQNPPGSQNTQNQGSGLQGGEVQPNKTKENQPKGIFGSITEWISIKAFTGAINIISGILGAVFGWILKVEASIIVYLLDPTNFPIVKARIVNIGWNITRDIANMFFILALLIMAVATTLRIQTYTLNQLFPKLIVAALLINFSLIIAGIVIDFTQVFTKFFYDQINTGGVTFAMRIVNAMKLTNFYEPDASLAGAANSLWLIPAGAIGALVATIVAVFTFGAAILFLTIRIGWLWFLLIFAPLVWALWIIPQTSHHFGDWWKKLFQWSFFAPVYTFMIYISLSIFDASGQLIDRGKNIPPDWNQSASGFQGGAPSAFFQFALTIFMLFGSLLVAQNFSVYGAKGATDTLKSWGTESANWAGRRLRRGFLQATKPVAPGAAPAPGAPLRTRLAYGFKKAGAAVGTTATAIPGLREQYLKMAAAEAKTVEDYKGPLKDVPTAILANTLATSPTLFGRKKLAYAEVLAEKGKLNAATHPAFNDPFIASLLQIAQKEKREGVILNNAPDLARLIGKSVAEAVRQIPVSKAENIRQEAFAFREPANNKAEVLLNLTGAHFERIGKEGSAEMRNQVKGEIEKAINDALTGTTTGLTPLEWDRLTKLNDMITNSPLWNI